MFVTKGKQCIYYEMAKLTSKKRKNYAFTKKKSLANRTLKRKTKQYLNKMWDFDKKGLNIVEIFDTHFNLASRYCRIGSA